MRFSNVKATKFGRFDRTFLQSVNASNSTGGNGLTRCSEQADEMHFSSSSLTCSPTRRAGLDPMHLQARKRSRLNEMHYALQARTSLHVTI